jgi:hypothetical protein
MKKNISLLNFVFELIEIIFDHMKNKYSFLIHGIIAIFIISISFSCKRNTLDVNVSGIKTNIEIKRFEKALFSADPSMLEKEIPRLRKDYGKMFDHFCYILRLGNPGDPTFPERLRLFVTDKVNYDIYRRTLEVFPDTILLAKQLNNAFSHFTYYFPDKSVPRIYTYVSSFSESAITDDSLLAIGLDRYLGSGEKMYMEAGIYSYLSKNMRPDKIASDCMNFWGETEFVFNDSVNNLIANMIYRGRLLYFISAMIPEAPDSMNWGFTGREIEYLEKNEKSMWAYLVEHKLLFSSDRFEINKFIQEGPFTAGFGNQSPARAAVWIGYRIIKAYVQRNGKTTLPELMAQRDYLKILNLSGYNP